MMPTLGLTAIVRKGERQYVALCPELDVVSQGSTIDGALTNLKEACELYLEEAVEAPEGICSMDMIITRFEVVYNAKAPSAVGRRADQGTR